MGWESSLKGIATPPLGSRVTVHLETDDELRERIIYVAGDSERDIRMMSMAKGADLDAIAETYGLKRRNT